LNVVFERFSCHWLRSGFQAPVCELVSCATPVRVKSLTTQYDVNGFRSPVVLSKLTLPDNPKKSNPIIALYNAVPKATEVLDVMEILVGRGSSGYKLHIARPPVITASNVHVQISVAKPIFEPLR